MKTIISTILFTFIVGCGESPIPPSTRGPQWVTYRGTNVRLLSNKINDIASSRAGQVWIATDSGATLFEAGLWGSFADTLRYWLYGYQTKKREAKVNAITIGKDGSIWFGTGGGGVKRFFQNNPAIHTRWASYDTSVLTSPYIRDMAVENIVNGDVWITTFIAGVNRFIPNTSNPEFGRWEQYTAEDIPEFRSNQMYAVGVNFLDHSIWISSLYSVMVFINDVSGWRQYSVPSQYDYTILSFAFDISDYVWMGKKEGASALDEERAWEHYTFENTGRILPDGPVNTVTTDLRTIRWFGTNNGLARLDGATWTVFTQANTPALPSDSITALCYDYAGNLWIGTSDGLAVYNPEGTNF